MITLPVTGPVPVPSATTTSTLDFHLNTALVTALVIGIPSVIVAISSYYLSVRAKKEAAQSARGQIDAGAYDRARELYESAITELRKQIADLRTEQDRLQSQLDDTRRELRELKNSRSRRSTT